MGSTKQARREQAALRQAKYNELSIDQKIERTIQKQSTIGGCNKELNRLLEKKGAEQWNHPSSL